MAIYGEVSKMLRPAIFFRAFVEVILFQAAPSLKRSVSSINQEFARHCWPRLASRESMALAVRLARPAPGSSVAA
jgi:hypothetical protein